MTVHQLAPFQSAAVDHIVARLRDPKGSRRFLLADEVGLGKTIVAKGIIERLAQRRNRPLRVVYLCSNSEIAEQNRSKLITGGGLAVRRVTELVAAARPPKESAVWLYAFTPGTSLAGGTGMAWERQLMLFLLEHATGIDVSTRKWRDLFRCAAGAERWDKDSRWDSLKARYARKVSSQFRERLRNALQDGPHFARLGRRLEEAADSFNDSAVERKRRNRVLSEFRGAVQRAALSSLAPDLVILDEVQRFKEVIDKAADSSQIASQLFAERAPVLILSATPYRFFTPDQEVVDVGSSHHEDFFRTLRFLFADDSRTPVRIRRSLDDFGKGLGALDLAKPKDDRLVALKRDIERDLRKVVCRTERNWYFEDLAHKPTDAGPPRNTLPGRAELREFFEIHRGVAAHVDCSAMVTDFWKSAPSLLTFVDAKYALVKRLVSGRHRVPRMLLSSAGDAGLIARNLRLKHVVDHALGSTGAPPFLWAKPTYTYHQDTAYGDAAPSKMLVFSGWRFVPKAVAVAVSNQATARLPKASKERRQPLRFTEKKSFHVFDVCCPVWSLAEQVDVRPVAPGDDSRTADKVLQSAVEQLREIVRAAGIGISATRGDPTWCVVARLESANGHHAKWRKMVSRWPNMVEASDDYAARDRNQFLEWMRSTSGQVCISEAQLRHLALIAVGSPAVCLLRSLLTQFGADEIAAAEPTFADLCFESLRTYLNRPLQQQAVRQHKSSLTRRRREKQPGFAERVLRYSLDHHLQAVLDEDVYLQVHASGKDSVEKLLTMHFRAAWSLSRGSRRTNAAVGRGDRVAIRQDAESWPIHFALAFGEEGEVGGSHGDEPDAEKRMRRSDVREAFNSPFWPFVLATTSVGQEGLDFHLYCKDIFHWNLPSNPVDLEQREGRINRRDCLAIRHSIASDWPLSHLRQELAQGKNPWEVVFRSVQADKGRHRFKHGLSPHWVYECADESKTARITRHVAFFEASRDEYRYRRLQTGLALYRLVFGQVNQEHLLGDIERRLEGLDETQRERAQRRLASYMLNLSPVGAAEAMKLAVSEAELILSRPAELAQLLRDVEAIALAHGHELSEAQPALERLLAVVQHAVPGGARSRAVRQAVTALCYLRNPYDQFFDAAAVGGFDDDIRVLARAASNLSMVTHRPRTASG